MANAVDLTWTSGPLKVREMEAKKTLPESRSCFIVIFRLHFDQYPLEIFGFPTFVFEGISTEELSQNHVVVRLCDVFPNGQSRLISYGVINLASIDREPGSKR